MISCHLTAEHRLAIPFWVLPHSTYIPCFLCHPSILSSPYTSCTCFFPSGHLTHLGFEFPSTQTISSGSGNSVSIADAKGWMRSGQW